MGPEFTARRCVRYHMDEELQEPHYEVVLWGTGTVKRQGLALILHDTSRPMSLPAPDWTPTGTCAPK